MDFICIFLFEKLLKLVSDHVEKTEKRLRDIKSWIGFSDNYLNSWITLGSGFLKWLHQKVDEKKLESISGVFPQLWKSFLQESNQTDQIPWE